MSMENPKWVDGQKSILEQKSMSMEEEKDTSWEARLNKQFFGGVPMDEMGSNQIEESELQGFIRQEREAAKEEEREKSRIEREALLREILEDIRSLYQDTTIHAAGGTYFEREDSERNETINEVLSIIKKKI